MNFKRLCIVNKKRRYLILNEKNKHIKTFFLQYIKHSSFVSLLITKSLINALKKIRMWHDL